MGPAQLTQSRRIRRIGRQAVAAQDPRKHGAEQTLQDVRAPGRRDGIEDKRGGPERPEPPLVAVGAVARFIAVEDRLMGQGLFECLARRGDGRTGFFPRLLRAAHAHWKVQRAFEQPLHDEARQATDDRQIRNQGRELRAKLACDLDGQWRLRRLPARGTAPSMAAIFGNVRLDGRQFGDLMPSRIADLIAHLQGMLAMTTRVGDERHDRSHALGRNQRSPVAGMTRLPTALPSTLGAATPFALTSGQSIGGRRLRGRRRVLLPQGQLVFQVGNLLFRVRDLLRPLRKLPIAFSQVALQPLILALQPLTFRLRAFGALAPVVDRAGSLILVASRGHTEFMADSRKKYKYGIWDHARHAEEA